MKRFTAFLLCAALCLSPALAVGEEKFPAVNVYPGYADVKETDWFYDTAKLCYEIGLMTGTDKGFEPNKTLTGPECAALAARLREKLTGKPIPEPTPDPGLPWYQHYRPCPSVPGWLGDSLVFPRHCRPEQQDHRTGTQAESSRPRYPALCGGSRRSPSLPACAQVQLLTHA